MSKKKKSYWTQLLKVCRQHWSRNSPDRKQCFKDAKFGNRIHSSSSLERWICKHCERVFALSEVQCDHVIPIANTIPQSEEEFEISSRKLHSKNLQILCKECHKLKTKDECLKRRNHLLVTLVQAYIQNHGYNKHQYELDKLDRKLLRDLSTLFAKNIKTSNQKLIDKNASKIASILKSCERSAHG